MENVLGDNIGFVYYIDSMGDDTSIVRNARVSYGNDYSKTLTDRDKKLIEYLLKNKHTSPLESVNFTFNIKCPLFIARQWMRHRTWSYNEISRRYTSDNLEFYIPKEFRIQSSDNKQMSTGELLNSESSDEYSDVIKMFCEDAVQIYESMIESGVAREIARGVLPQFLYTNFYATVDLHNLFHFLELRRHPHAQHEIQLYAKAIEDIIKEIVPFTYQTWNDLMQEKYNF
jgi:thymidylate synthase (FAD)